MFSFRLMAVAWLAGLVLAFFPVSGLAQPLAQIKKDIGAEDSKAAETPAAKDLLGRETPRGLIMGFLDAVSREDWQGAASYLDLSFLPKASQKMRGKDIAQGLQTLLNQGGWIMPNSMISDQPPGKENDTLDPKQDRIGTLRTDKQSVDLLAERSENADGTPIWLISAQTLKQVPAMVEDIRPPLINTLLPDILIEHKIWGVPVGHWLALFILAVLAYVAAWGLTILFTLALRMACRRLNRQEIHIFDAFRLPARLYLAVWLFVYASIFMGISALARQHFSLATVIVGWLSLIVLVWRLIDIVADRSQQHMSRLGKLGMMSVIHFLRRSAKFIFMALAGILILGTFGVDVRAGLAALGIGGIALALGAQKTVENFVGSLMLIVDQPVRLGDFCKIGDTQGTVEDIGMRSTRLRTLARTVVTIPNGEFSSLQIENYARRDRFLFHHTLGVRYETTTDQMRWLLVKLRSLLYAHPRISQEPCKVRFVKLDSSSLNIEILAYVIVGTFDEFQEVQEDLLLRIMETVEKAGTGFAFPSQTVYNGRDIRPTPEQAEQIAAQVRQWRDNNELPLPKFSPEQIEKLKDTLDFPPEGSVMRQG